MRIQTKILAPAMVALFALAACTVEKTQEGEAPDVEVKGGQLPKYDVDAPKVEVSTDTQKVVTPDVDIKPATEANDDDAKQ